MAKRKTVSVDAMLEKFNNILAHQSVSQESKIGICTAVEIMLMEANRYSGFKFNNMTYNVATERYDIDPDTEYNRTYFIKTV